MPQPRPISITLLVLIAFGKNACGAPLLQQPEGVACQPAGPEGVASPLHEPSVKHEPSAKEVQQVQVLEVVPPPALTPVGPGSPLTRPISQLSLTASAEPRLVAQMTKVPDQFAIHNAAEGQFGAWDAPLYDASRVEPRHPLKGFHFAAPASYSRPLYFEQENLERYGHSIGWCDNDVVTPSVISTAHFFATAAVLPYKIGAQPPRECSYVLGAFRPGSCNPHHCQVPRESWRGLLYQGAAVTGLVFLVP